MEQAEADLLMSPRGAAALEAEAALPGTPDPFARSAALRRAGFSAGETAALLTQADLRRRAAGRLGPDAARLLLTRAGLEQATRREVAAEHAARVRAAGFDDVVDLGCGIGGDALAFAAAGLAVRAVERDPVTAALARHNLAPFPGARVEVGEAETTEAADGAAVWLDPARRTAGHSDTRRLRPDDWSPSLDFVAGLLSERAAGVKLAPGLDHELIPPGVEAQWVSSGREVAELVLWSGGLARPGTGRAALVLGRAGAAELTGPGPAVDVPPGPLGGVVAEPDGAVIRSGLLGDLARATGSHPVGPGIAYLTGDAIEASPFLDRFAVEAVLPLDPRLIARELRARGIGRLEVKKRGVDLEPAAFRRRLGLKGDGEAVLIATRTIKRRVALLCRRLR
ncbi:THUMP-like domain-containing protein [Amnibacterium endophyticum]|uniref:SAM-dependent methyltransferase n=1 Tax=Amnibacterium endophyticum TaxID=2109337 RepID=A0ABW4LCV5_9MICO